ncbi:hypothetical protein [Fodinibius saliphilus]|uniref:hypothetical protein n=1 Tax=Fodinibius saliphilus TaxID=1920650 RepID=UPI00110938C4|nr:hypothetical protein [Fodinibius saliphilus]
MRTFIFCILVLVFNYSALAQPVTTTFEQSKEQGISFVKLDSLYHGATHANPQKNVFKEHQTKFLKSIGL